MKHLFSSYILFLLVLSSLVSADILSINYPAPNDIISESSRVRLDVTSNGTSSNCYFNYDDIKNVSIDCNGISLVNFPAKSETYRIRVGDDAGSYITQQVTINKENGVLPTVIIIFAIVIMMLMFFMFFHILGRLLVFEVGLYDAAITYVIIFGYFLVYQLMIDVVNLPFLISWLDIFKNISLWFMSIFTLIAYVVCFIYRVTTKKKVDKNSVWGGGGNGLG
jgi:hypothetical protein